MWNTKFAGHEGSTRIDAVHQVVALHRRVLGIGQSNGTCVVDTDIDSSKCFDSLVDGGLHICFVANINLEWGAPYRPLLQFPRLR